MVTISLNNLGKKYNREWIFRKLDLEIMPGSKLAILGGNGSGKSTLLQVISGFVTPNEGRVNFIKDQGKIETDEMMKHISFASPYIQLIEEYSLPEIIEHVTKFKIFRDNLSTDQVIDIIQLSVQNGKPIKQYSSGMKQRLKLGLAFLANTSVLLLDEPVSNLDKEAIEWYKTMVLKYCADRTVIVCSNAINDEFYFCDTTLRLMDFKPSVNS